MTVEEGHARKNRLHCFAKETSTPAAFMGSNEKLKQKGIALVGVGGRRGDGRVEINILLLGTRLIKKRIVRIDLGKLRFCGRKKRDGKDK